MPRGIFSLRVMKLWNRLSKRSCGFPIPGVVQGQVQWGPGSLIYLDSAAGDPATAGGWNKVNFEASSNPSDTRMHFSTSFS